MQRVIVLNPKGGSGKTTIASNLAACFAVAGQRPALLDLDAQASSMRWLRKRPDDCAAIHGIAGFERTAAVTRSWQLRIPAECGVVVVDTPAAGARPLCGDAPPRWPTQSTPGGKCHSALLTARGDLSRPLLDDLCRDWAEIIARARGRGCEGFLKNPRRGDKEFDLL